MTLRDKLKIADATIAACAKALRLANARDNPPQLPGHAHPDGVHWDGTNKVCRECAAWRKAMHYVRLWQLA